MPWVGNLLIQNCFSGKEGGQYRGDLNDGAAV